MILEIFYPKRSEENWQFRLISAICAEKMLIKFVFNKNRHILQINRRNSDHMYVFIEYDSYDFGQFSSQFYDHFTVVTMAL
jgi:hypothetical protein